MKQLIIKNGKLSIEEIPKPELEPFGILVKTIYSAISSGTEKMVKESKENITKPGIIGYGIRYLKDRDFREKVHKILQEKGLAGLMKAKKKVASISISPIGYSCVGRVIAVGEYAKEEFKVGDIVVCGGAGFANHAEINYIPKNLAVRVPEGVKLEEAALTTIASIALQGIRQLDPKIGENIVVIGLGLIGQIIAQLLKVTGCKVFGVDIKEERVKIAEEKGYIDRGFINLEPEELKKYIKEDGFDGVIITASAKDNGKIINSAFDLCRRKGRVVLVGVVNLNINRAKMYKKELEFKIATSYGPGRYDRLYEEFGIDYPLAYVRFTEKRNMETILELLKQKKLDFSYLIGGKFSLDEAERAYEEIESGRIFTAVFKYDEKVDEKTKVIINKSKGKEGKIKIGVIGPGNFFKSMHLPNIKKIDEFEIVALAARNGTKIKALGEELKVKYVTTDAKELIEDPEIDLIFITTQHNTHAEYTLEALKAGKHVFVEKPIALTLEELEKIRKEKEERTDQVLLIGHNRSFSPFIEELEKHLDKDLPITINYRVNAGYIPKDHWTQNPEIGGGRLIGEGVHFVDLIMKLAGEVTNYSIVKAKAKGKYLASDNYIATFEFENGSIAAITYTAYGSKEIEKELIEVFNAGYSYRIEDFKRFIVYGKGIKIEEEQDKGHFKELLLLKDAILGKVDLSEDLERQLKATEITLRLKEML